MKKILLFILYISSSTTFGQVVSSDTSSNVFIAVLKDGLDSVNATINDVTTFVATKGELILYWNDPHTAYIADGRFGYIPIEKLKKVDTNYFKFNFSKAQFYHDNQYELYLAAQSAKLDLNNLVKRTIDKETKALLEYFRLKNVVDGAATEEFFSDFWELINLWSDNELCNFILTLNETEKKEFCDLLIDTAYCNPYKYYKLYYPMTLKQIKATR